MIRFIGKDGVVFQGNRVEKKVTHGFLSQTKFIEPTMSIVDGAPHTGTYVFEKQSDTEEQGYVTLESLRPQPFDLVSYYRMLLTLELEPEVEADQMSINLAAFMTMDEDLVRDVVDRIGVKAFKHISTEMPPNLGEAIAFLKKSGIEVNKRVLMQEVRLGNQVYNQVLRDAGVENPKDIDERRSREKAAVEQYLPALRGFIDAQRHPVGCDCVQRLADIAIEVLKRGITEEGLVIGMAQIIGVASSPMADTLCVFASMYRTDPNKLLVESVSTVLVEAIEKQKAKPNRKDADYYIRTLSDLQKHWETLPTVEL